MTSSGNEITREELMDLSLDAAIEIERAILSQTVNFEIIRRMIEAMGKTFQPGPTTAFEVHLIDPRVISMYGRALRNADAASVTTAGDVKNWISGVADRYKSLEGISTLEGGTESLARQLRNFFLALHKELVAEIVPDRPESHPTTRGQRDLAAVVAH